MGEGDGSDAETLASRVADVLKDTVVLLVILFSIWLVGSSLKLLWGEQGLVFFKDSAFHVPADWVIDSMDLGTLVLYAVRVLWIFLRGVWR